MTADGEEVAADSGEGGSRTQRELPALTGWVAVTLGASTVMLVFTTIAVWIVGGGARVRAFVAPSQDVGGFVRLEWIALVLGGALGGGLGFWVWLWAVRRWDWLDDEEVERLL